MMKFRDSKYVNPKELDAFPTLLSQAVSNIRNRAIPIKSSKRHPGAAGLELWPLAHHTTLGHYYCYTTQNSKEIEIWLGLDLFESDISLILWFDEPDKALVIKPLLSALIAAQTPQYYDDFCRFYVPPLDQFWIRLKQSEFDRLYNAVNATAAVDIIEKFIEEILKIL